MLYIATKILTRCGATIVTDRPFDKDPTSQEELNKLEYVSEKPITWEEYAEQLPIVKTKLGLEFIRNYRNKELQETDYLMTVDVFPTLLYQEEWIQYRKALRDLPDTVTEYIFFYDYQNLDFSKLNMPKRPSTVKKSDTS